MPGRGKSLGSPSPLLSPMVAGLSFLLFCLSAVEQLLSQSCLFSQAALSWSFAEREQPFLGPLVLPVGISCSFSSKSVTHVASCPPLRVFMCLFVTSRAVRCTLWEGWEEFCHSEMLKFVSHLVLTDPLSL